MNKVFNELGNITSYTVEVESWKRLHDSLKHEPIVVGESNVELLKLNFGGSASLSSSFGQIDKTFGCGRVPIADLKVDCHLEKVWFQISIQ